MTATRLKILYDKCLARQASPAEKAELLQMMDLSDNEEAVKSYIDELLEMKKPLQDIAPQTITSILEAIVAADVSSRPVHRIHFLKTAWFRYAAILLLVAGTATYLYTSSFRRNPEVLARHEAPKPQDILPGSDKAVLTLAGGRQIRLDSTANTVLAEKGISNRNALISYTNQPAVATINILTTPRGGQYKLQLSDGTIVWLNAASSITYPTVFNDKKREVTITGEVYFEVARNTGKPFLVKTPSDEIQVLGTSFNINAYADEKAVRTTLVEGSIRIGTKTLKPGEACFRGMITKADMAKDIAWITGQFNFDGVQLADAMRQLARWYDLEIVYENGIPNIQFGGSISRNMKLSNVLLALEKAGVHFKMTEGRKLIVAP